MTKKEHHPELSIANVFARETKEKILKAMKKKVDQNRAELRVLYRMGVSSGLPPEAFERFVESLCFEGFHFDFSYDEVEE